MITVLVSAYAVNPFKGSEDGTGWNYILQIAKNQNVIAYTRKNNRLHIEQYQNQYPSHIYQKITFCYFDLPFILRFWKKGDIGAIVYFYIWQFCLAMSLFFKKRNYDIVHNLNFHTDWIPTFLWVLRKPLVWGPIGHHPIIPSSYLAHFKQKSNIIKQSILYIVKKVSWEFGLFFKLAKVYSDKIIVINSEVEKVLNIKEDKIIRSFSVCSENVEIEENDKKDFVVLSVGRFVSLKGFEITILSFCDFLKKLKVEERGNVKLILVGKGPLLPFFHEIISKNRVENNVEIINWISRDELRNIYIKSSIFFFPSHEGAGMVVPEALSYGLPVLCLDNCGPGEMITSDCGIKIKYVDVNSVVALFSLELSRLFSNKILLKTLSKGARKRFETTFDWDLKSELLKDIYLKLLKP